MKKRLERRGLRAAALLTTLGGLGLVAVIAIVLSARGGGTTERGIDVLTAASPTASGTLAPVSSASLAPATALAHAAQEPVTYSPPPPPTPTPAPPEGTWRWEGVVVDEKGKPIEDVCIAVGPHGCQPTSVRTDKRGVWFIDFPQAPVDYDLHFTKKGYPQYDVRITPTSPWTLNVVLKG